MARRPDPVGLDAHAADLLALYERADRQLTVMLMDARDRGLDWTTQHREQQQATVQTIIARLRQQSPELATRAAQTAYTHGALATDAALGNTGAAFGGVHQQAVDVLIRSLNGRLDDAIQTVGRNADDVFRTSALKQLALREATGETSAAAARNLADDLVHQGITSFTDSRGARWTLRNYTRMVARTTVREAVTVSTANRMIETGNDLVTISEHGDDDELCSPYEGNTYSLTGTTPGYDVLDELPPFHPNCVHVITPASASFDAFAAELGIE